MGQGTGVSRAPAQDMTAGLERADWREMGRMLGWNEKGQPRNEQLRRSCEDSKRA